LRRRATSFDGMNFHTKIILHPTDFSNNAKNVLRYAGDLLQIKDARLVMLHVHEMQQGKHSAKGAALQEELNAIEKELPIKISILSSGCPVE